MRVHACLLCIAGMMPAGIDPVFGPVYQVCPHCHTTCLDCDGAAMFAAISDQALVSVCTAIYQLGHDILFCARCTGILGVEPLPLWPTHNPTVSMPDNDRRDDQGDTIHRVENVLRTLADSYYNACRHYAAAPQPDCPERLYWRTKLITLEQLGDQLADALHIAAPDWETIRDLATAHPEPGVNP